MMEGFNKDGMVMARMRAPRLSCQQFDVLINFMRAHPHFAAGRAGGSLGLTTREEHELWWQQLTEELNAAIGPTKSTPKWQKCWIDLKSNARGRVSKIRAALSNPGLEAITPTLTQWDHQVLSLMGPAYSDILALCKTQQRRDYSTIGDTAENNSNSSFHDQEHVYQHSENSPQASPFPQEENGHRIASSDAALRGVKRETEEDQEEILYEEVECDVGDAEYSEDLDTEQFHSLPNGVAARLGTSISPSVTVSPVTVPVTRPGNISLVSSSTTLQQRQIPVYSEIPSSRKRKTADVQDEEESSEKVPKGTLDVLERLARAAEESNAIQHQVVEALNRLSDNFSEMVKYFTSNAIGPKRKS